MNPAFQLVEGSWQEYKQALTAVRCRVFVDEQQVPVALELDEHDAGCHHVLVTASQGRPVAAGRIKPDGHIGRMAVLKDCRGLGIGTAMLAALMQHAREQGHASVFLHAQISAAPFYAKSGFVENGAPFMEAGIPHQCMVKPLP